jgi:hypothetical protein
MTSRIRFVRISRVLSALVVALVLSSILILPAFAKNSAGDPGLNSFIESVRDGNSDVLRGVYVQDQMAFQIIQQPAGYPGFVSQDQGQVTQFGMAAEAGNVGLLAHNYLSGRSFSLLTQGDRVVLVYGDGRTESFVVSRILQYQALDPNNPYSDFRVTETQSVLSAAELFDQVYRGERHVTFQTCIEADGNLSWGRLFVIAEPAADLINSSAFTEIGNTYKMAWRSQ